MANYNKSFNFRNGVQVDDDNFIVNANGLVGIGTSIPREFLDVHGTAKITGLVTATNLAVTGVSTFYGNVNVGSGVTVYASTGIVSATAFYGDGSNLLNVEQIAVDGWIVNAGNLSTTSKVGIGTTIPYYSLQVGLDPLTGNGLSIDALTGNVNTTGIITAPSFVGDIEGNINSSGVSTFSGGILGNVTGNVTGNINSSGVSTFSGGLIGNVTGNVVGIASTARDLISDARVSIAHIASQTSSIGISTVSTGLYAESIGVGTNSPSSDIHIRRTSTSKLQVTSDTAEAIVAVGRSTTLTGSNGALRFGNTSGLYPYSTQKTLDIINYDTGNINQYLHYGFAGIGTGNFNWLYGQSATSPLMSLTYGGNLGLGITNPTSKLYVVGSSYISGVTTIDNNLSVNGNINCSGNLNGNISNINATGVSTFSNVIINSSLNASTVTSTFGFVGIGTDNPTDRLTVHDGDISVGINTSNGLVLTSADGTKYRLFVSNAGVLSTVLVP